jgi:short-subunit dehydrogenase
MHALITGASSGIGASLAKSLASEGYDLSLVARREGLLQSVADPLRSKVRAEVLPADLSDLDRIDDLLRESRESLGPIDLLVNNAGVEIVRRTLDVAVEEYESLMRVNVMAPFRLIRCVLPEMIERGSGQIVNISSVAAYTSPPFVKYYSASKAALSAASDSLASELRGRGVHVLNVYPGLIDTSLADRGIADLGAKPPWFLPWGRPEILSRKIVNAIKRRRRTVVYPWLYWIPKWFPGISRMVIEHYARKLTERASP